MPRKSALIIPVLRASRSDRGGFVSLIYKDSLSFSLMFLFLGQELLRLWAAAPRSPGDLETVDMHIIWWKHI